MNLQQAHRRVFSSSVNTIESHKGSCRPIRRTRALIALSTAVAGVISYSSVTRADTFGNNGGINLNLASSWTDETNASVSGVPGINDIARWDNLSTGGSFNLGTGTFWAGISIANPASAVTIGSAADATAGGALNLYGGIDMTAATQNLTLADGINISVNQTWNVGNGMTLTQSGALATGVQSLTLAGAGNFSSGGVISGSGTVTMSGTGNLTLNTANTFAGGMTVNSGTVTVGNATSLGTGILTLVGGNVVLKGSSNANGLSIPAGANGTISITATNQVNSTATGSGTLNLSITQPAIYNFTNRIMFQNFTGLIELGSSQGQIRCGGSSGATPMACALDLGTSTGSFNTSKGGTTSIGALSGGPSTVMTAVTTNTYVIGSLGLSTVFQGTILPTVTENLQVVGGTLTLTGNNAYTGTTTTNGGTLQIGNGGTTGSMGTGAVTNNTALAYDPGVGGSFTVPNAISGSGVFNHIGPGVTTLTGTNSFSGGTTISAGTLQVDNLSNALGTGAITVNSSAALGGIGVINAGASVNSGGIISPGDLGVNHGSGVGVGTLTLNTLSLASGAIVNFDIGALAGDMVNISNGGGLTLGTDGVDLYQAGTTSPVTANGTYNLFNVSGGYSGSVSGLSVLNPQASLSYTFGVSGNFITVTVAGGATTSAWNSNTGGSWATAANWTSAVPNAQGAIALLGTSPGIITPSTVTLDGNKTVGSLTFNNSVGNGNTVPTSYTVAAGSGGSLIFDNGANSAILTDTNGTQLISAPVVLNSALSLSVVNAADTLTFSGPVSGAGGVNTAGAGTVVFAGTDSFGGGLSVGGGTTILTGNNSAVAGAISITSGATLQVGNGGATGSLPAGAIANAGALQFNLASGTTTVAGNISGVGSVTQSGNNIVTLNGTNSYSGTTTVNSGTLQLGNSSALGAGTLTVNGGTLDLNGYNASVGSFSGAGNIDNVSAGGSPTLTVNSASSTTFSGSIKNTTGTVNLVKSGSGTLSLSGSSSYTGSTNVTAGALKIASGGSLNPTGTINDGVTDGLVLGNGVTLGNPIVDNSGTNEFINVSDAGATATLASNVTVGSTASQLRLGITGGSGATLTVTGNENSTGTIGILTRGTLIFANSGTFAITNSSTGTANALLIARSGNLNITLENNSVVSSQANIDTGQAQSSDGNFVATIQDNALLSAVTTFDLNDLNNTNASTVINLNGGTLSAGSFVKHYNDANHVATVNLNGGVIAASSSTTAFLPAFAGLTMNVSTGGAIFNDGGNAITVSAPLVSAASPDGGFTKLGAGNLTLAGSNTYNGGTNVSAGTLTFGAPGALPIYTTLNVLGTSTAVAAPFVAGNTKNSLFVSNLNLAGATNAWTSKLDLTNNDLVVQNGNLKTIINQIKQGFGVASAPFQGSGGITSSTAAADTTHLTALGVIQNSSDGTPGGSVLYGSFDGQNSVDTDVLVKYTYFGDANLDGKVDGSDYTRIDSGFTAHSTGWFNGDFNYDGVVNGSDYTLIDNAFNTQGAQISAQIATATAQIGGSAVPEPASLGLLTLAMGGLLGRRRRN